MFNFKYIFLWFGLPNNDERYHIYNEMPWIIDNLNTKRVKLQIFNFSRTEISKSLIEHTNCFK